MAKREDIKKVLIIGSGPIVIGQAAEFDYAGTQACLALKEEGYEVILCNSNPATIMTDTSIADKVYMEPLTLEYVAKILRYERPDAIVPGIGGQTGLNLAMQLDRKGVLAECRVKLLGTPADSIERAEDRELFKEMCESIGEPVIPSEITYSIEEAKELYDCFMATEEDSVVSSALDVYTAERRLVEEEIEAIRKGFPFNAVEVLNDPAKQEEYMMSLKLRAKQCEIETKQVKDTITELLRGTIHG